MHSSTSSSEGERRVSDRRFGAVAAGAAALALAGVVGWELHFRAEQYTPAPQNSDGLWASARRRVEVRPDSTVIVGSSRILFDTDLDVWAEVMGAEPPIQLAIEGTSGRAFLADLARDPRFAGFVVVGVTPGLFFSPRMGFRADVIDYWKSETPAQRIGQWLSVRLEKRLAFLDSDTKLFTRLERLSWPERPGMRPPLREPRKLMVMDERRNTRMWEPVETDPAYRTLARDIWRGFIEMPHPPLEAAELDGILEAVAGDVEAIRGRGGEVVFVRPPSGGLYLESETSRFPRADTWDRLLRRCRAQGVHFADVPELAAMEPPEWSHLAAGDRAAFTRAVAGALRSAFSTWQAGTGSSNAG